MDEELPINPFITILAQKIIVAAVIFFLLAPGFKSSRNRVKPVIDKPLISEAVPSPSAIETDTDNLPEYSPEPIYKHKKEHLFHPIIVQAAHNHQVDPALIKAIIKAESSYNPNAISKRGAKGLMQLMPRTAEALGVEDSFNPEQNIKGGVRYFKNLVNQFDGDVKLALAAYNAGSRTVRKYQGVPPYKSTKYYIKKVFQYYHFYKNQPERKTDRV
ncbi:lytic transglycosylase domain-containing protein [Thermodesulfobacteriota bacterium]